MRTVAIVVALICAVSFIAPAYGAQCSSCASVRCQPCHSPCDCPPDGTPLQKLGRGFCNCITFPMEIFHQMGCVNQTDGPMAGLTWGLLKGVGMAGVRAVVGVYEVATFPIPCPECYRPILTSPEYFFENTNY